ncbi:MAG TPA: serine/threonine-protein kinase [Ilumatobacteraceae bacterium]|nr:serine/threonine-protein kinase [Ilumatobacteraceae bacterium]
MQPEFPGFEQLELIGRGTNTDVYRAVRVSTSGTVALKVFHAGLDAETVARRLRREVDALVALRGHPHIVGLEEVIHHGAQVALVMEFAPGGSMADLMRKESLTLQRLVDIARSTALALGSAHDSGIVHRDVKPENILIGAFDQVRVCDFGMAFDGNEASPSQTSKVSIQYASPEELDGLPVMAASDTYSLGAVMFHAVGGRAPRLADRGAVASAPEMVGKPPKLVHLIGRCMASSAAHRPTMADIVTALNDPTLLDAQPATTAVAPTLAVPVVSAAPPPPVVRHDAPAAPPPAAPPLTERRPSRPMAGPSAANETTAIAFNRPAPTPEPAPPAGRGLLPVVAAAFVSAALAFGLMYLLLK